MEPGPTPSPHREPDPGIKPRVKWRPSPPRVDKKLRGARTKSLPVTSPGVQNPAWNRDQAPPARENGQQPPHGTGTLPCQNKTAPQNQTRGTEPRVERAPTPTRSVYNRRRTQMQPPHALQKPRPRPACEHHCGSPNSCTPPSEPLPTHSAAAAPRRWRGPGRGTGDTAPVLGGGSERPWRGATGRTRRRWRAGGGDGQGKALKEELE